jgi:hypothetical protein
VVVSGAERKLKRATGSERKPDASADVNFCGVVGRELLVDGIPITRGED